MLFFRVRQDNFTIFHANQLKFEWAGVTGFLFQKTTVCSSRLTFTLPEILFQLNYFGEKGYCGFFGGIWLTDSYFHLRCLVLFACMIAKANICVFVCVVKQHPMWIHKIVHLHWLLFDVVVANAPLFDKLGYNTSWSITIHIMYNLVHLFVCMNVWNYMHECFLG
jgi:hypothetical protein